MPLTLSSRVATLSGVVTVDDAEPLARWLRDTARPRVKLAAVTHLHTSVLQALLALRPAVAAAPTDPFLARWVMPLLSDPAGADAADPGPEVSA